MFGIGTKRSQTPTGDSSLQKLVTNVQQVDEHADIADIFQGLTTLLWHSLILFAIGAAAYVIYSLFYENVRWDLIGSVFGTIISVGLTVGLFMLRRTAKKHSVRGLSTIFLVSWLAL